jgi:hypothetical protein
MILIFTFIVIKVCETTKLEFLVYQFLVDEEVFSSGDDVKRMRIGSYLYKVVGRYDT